MVDLARVGSGVALAFTYDVGLRAEDYPLMYAYLHEKYTGEDKLYALGGDARERLRRMIGHRLLVGGVYVDELLVGKLRPGTHERHRDCTVMVALSLDETVRRMYNMNVEDIGVRWDVEMCAEGQLSVLRIGMHIARVVFAVVKEEIGAIVENGVLRKARYMLLPKDENMRRLWHTF